MRRWALPILYAAHLACWHIVFVLQGHLADQLLQVWEFACCFGPLLGLEQVPSPQQLERGLLGVVSHTGESCRSCCVEQFAGRGWRCAGCMLEPHAFCR